MKLSYDESIIYRKKIIKYFNEIMQLDKMLIQEIDNQIIFVNEIEDLKKIGEGGFAKVYIRKSTDLVEKYLKSEFCENKDILSRFKREFEITKELQNIIGIVKVYELKNNNTMYTMEYYEKTLSEYIKDNFIDENKKIGLIQSIVKTMSEVHNRGYLHRDLSPTNIFIEDEKILIGDFGLGKNLNVVHSHQTVYTKDIGQYDYCAPEQMESLKKADKRSDVFSMGKIINFIMTKSPKKKNHIFKAITEKATSLDSSIRYSDADELKKAIEKAIQIYNDQTNIKRYNNLIEHNIYNKDIELYISEMSGENIFKYLCELKNFDKALCKYLEANLGLAFDIVNELYNICTTQRLNWVFYDDIAKVMLKIINNTNFTFDVREISARALKYIAEEINRFGVQKEIEKLINKGIEPMLEEILQNSYEKNNEKVDINIIKKDLNQCIQNLCINKGECAFNIVEEISYQDTLNFLENIDNNIKKMTFFDNVCMSDFFQEKRIYVSDKYYINIDDIKWLSKLFKSVLKYNDYTMGFVEYVRQSINKNCIGLPF